MKFLSGGLHSILVLQLIPRAHAWQQDKSVSENRFYFLFTPATPFLDFSFSHSTHSIALILFCFIMRYQERTAEAASYWASGGADGGLRCLTVQRSLTYSGGGPL